MSAQDEHITLQERIYNDLIEKIRSEEYPPGSQIPTEQALSAHYGVSRVTVRAALNKLVREQLLVRRQGKGTFVRKSVHVQNVFSSGSFTETCLRMNAQPSTIILSNRRAQADDDILARLKTADPTVIEIRRLRLVDNDPCIVEIDYLPPAYSFLLDLDLENRSILHAIHEHAGIVACQYEDYFQIVSANPTTAKLLECTEGKPLLEVTQLVSDRMGQPIYVNKQIIEAEKYIYAVRSNKGAD